MIVFLLIEIDTLVGELRLPEDKIERLKTTLQDWRGRSFYHRRDLESLIGILNHACKVVRSSRSFLR